MVICFHPPSAHIFLCSHVCFPQPRYRFKINLETWFRLLTVPSYFLLTKVNTSQWWKCELKSKHWVIQDSSLTLDFTQFDSLLTLRFYRWTKLCATSESNKTKFWPSMLLQTCLFSLITKYPSPATHGPWSNSSSLVFFLFMSFFVSLVFRTENRNLVHCNQTMKNNKLNNE